MKQLCFLCVFLSTFGFSQNLEEQIYVAAETFMANKNENSLKTLSQKEVQFKKQIQTKDEHLAMVFLQCHKGFYLDSNSKLKDAITAFEDALKRFNEHQLSTVSDFDIIESCMMPLGNLYTKTGDFTNAESIIKQYIFLAEKSKNFKYQISGAINLSKLYQTLGRHETVVQLTSAYIDDPNATKLQKQKLIEINIDSQIALGEISSDADVPVPLDSEKEYRLALQNKNYEKALRVFQNVKAERFSNEKLSTRYLAKLHLEEAQLLTLLGQNEAASESLNSALKKLIPDLSNTTLPKKEDLHAENTFIDIFDLYAEITTNTKTALYYYDLSFYVSELLRSGWTAQQTKILNQTATRIRSEKCIDLLYSAYAKYKDTSFAIKALKYAENSKASSLSDMFFKKQQLKKFPSDTLLQREFKLLKKQEHVTSLLVKEQLGGNRVSKINQFNKKLNELSISIKALKKAISKQYPNNNNTFSLKDLQHKLKKDQAILVEYFYGENHIYQFVVSEEGIHLNRIKKSSAVEKQIVDFINLFNHPNTINNNVANYTHQAFGMYKLLNVAAINETKNAVIIPDGLLNFVPFDALLTKETSTTAFSKMPFVVLSSRIAHNSSITMYLNTEVHVTKNKVLGLFPVFEGSSQALNFSVQEAKAIKDEMDSEILMKAEASKQNFIEKSKDYAILHLSTHAQSGDVANPASFSFYDEDLALNELYALDLNSHLVVLSACETGIGKLYKSEGAMSIARGFQYAGVQNLMFSLWQINDLSTSQIMTSFYTNFSNHQSAFIANSQSKIAYINNESISNTKKSPYYWSAFVYYGTVEPTKSQNFIFYVFFGFIIILIAIFLIYQMRKHARDRDTSGISS